MGAIGAACVQPWYVTPVGFTRRLERAAIHRIVKTGNDWLAARNGGRRVRICGKVLTFKAAPVPTVTDAGMGTQLVPELDAVLPWTPGRINLVFFDAPNTYTGGWADQPPVVPGHTAVVSLGGTVPWTLDYWPMVELHETLHALGIGHVMDDPHDLMAPQWASGPLMLDPSRSHYWDALMASPFLTGY